MEILVIVIIVLIALAIVGFMMRRKHNTEIERLENEKHQIQNKPILEEMTKVKQLNMNGQTEEMFERWRNTWTEVMDIHMPKIDSLLFDAEEYVDKFRFGKATATEKEIQNRIQASDEQMSQILTELEELIGSEEKSRIEMEQLKENYRSARKNLLAHQHAYGIAATALETRLATFIPAFEEYDALTESGNYLQAREIVIHLMEVGSKTFPLMHDIPALLSDLQLKLPSSIHELRSGQAEMEDQNYQLEHLELTEHLLVIENELKELLDRLANLDTEGTQSRLEEIQEELEQYYDLLEKEVHARRFVEQSREFVASRLKEVSTTTRETSDETAYVQQSYRLSEKEAQIPQNCLKKLESLQKRIDALNSVATEDKIAFSVLEEELTSIQTEMNLLYEEQEAFADSLKNLRIDENKARGQLDELKKQLHETDRMLQKANLPGIPEEMDARLEEAEEQLYLVMQSLQEVPLNMKVVDNYLGKAEKCIDEVHEKSKEMLENVLLIERIIQYGNRYRASHPRMHQRLLDAEASFRQLRYAKALETAATAVEEVEPGAMKRIEVLVKEDAWRS
ncbi:septation ring formation regulator EzrA [Paenisporosarcina cavernae]|uniref:Septation ring formation regulator EzrA n=1 Tax=Paenisporosarcina cavernae TaxID=2320858 RepID=A0A385YVD0_9BACL|nr:septation ring formation regulator EzrA [Paenisporosarcina cavernae]AYC29857.1 septation ring formation regulator EzrA [Paenisporosarcina cavernae]